MFNREWEWEWQISSNSSASMLAAAPGRIVSSMEGGDNVPYGCHVQTKLDHNRQIYGGGGVWLLGDRITIEDGGRKK